MLAHNATLLAFALTWAALGLYLVRSAHFAAGATRGGDHEVRPVRAVIKIAPAAAAATVLAAWLALATALVARGLAGGHWPLTNRYEFALCLCWVVLGVELWLEARGRRVAGGAEVDLSVGPAVLAMGALAITYAILQPTSERAIWPLLPALGSIWLPVHVLASAIAYGGCLVAGGLAAWQLLRPVQTGGGGQRAAWDVDGLMERSVALAFPWLTLSLLTGAIWAQEAWGRYWGWDPKESWALITWLWYLLLLHLRSNAGWQGQRRKAMIVAGLGLVVFTVAGLPWFVRTIRLESLHGF